MQARSPVQLPLPPAKTQVPDRATTAAGHVPGVTRDVRRLVYGVIVIGVPFFTIE